MDAPIIQVQLQRTTMDCGIAVLAMLLGKTYEEVLMIAAIVVPKVLERGIVWQQMRGIANRLGYKTKIKKARDISFTEDTGALTVNNKKWKTSHLVVLKEGLIVDTDGTIWDSDVYFKVNEVKATSLMVFEPYAY